MAAKHSVRKTASANRVKLIPIITQLYAKQSFIILHLMCQMDYIHPNWYWFIIASRHLTIWTIVFLTKELVKHGFEFLTDTSNNLRKSCQRNLFFVICTNHYAACLQLCLLAHNWFFVINIRLGADSCNIPRIQFSTRSPR